MKYIELTKGYKAIVDDEDFDELSKYKWHVRGNGYTMYAYRSGQSMHRFLLKPKSKEQVDHINRNGLDNRRCNIRICTSSQNIHWRRIKKKNEWGLIGINKVGKRWRARIRVDGEAISLGMFDTPMEAAKAYNSAAEYYLGDFAVLNKIM